jgi:thiosulfate dehydrogenase
MKGYVRAKLDCSACHLAGGTQARGGSFVGTYAYFPQWNKRSHRVIALQDRLAECFLYSMNGRPPAFASKEMVALVAYIAWLSRGTPSFSTPAPEKGFIEPLPSASPNVAHGATLYAQQCAVCHQASGAGIAGAFPPLWGAGSFNNGAGMAHIDRMTGFVMHNMPQNAPGSLTLQDSYDVSAYVLSQSRPKFDPTALVQSSPLPADYF